MLDRDIRIVLVETSHPGNVGGAARAMKTMGLDQLYLVRPHRYPNPQAEWRAAGATDVLRAARVVASLDDAIGECDLVIGTSTRRRRIPRPVVTPREAAAELPDSARRIAVLFGREVNGLTNEELTRCQYHLAVPANPDYPSLNLAMAVQVVCYELYQALANADGAAKERWDRPFATDADVQNLFEHFDRVLTRVGFHDPDNPGQAMNRFRRMFGRIRLDATEVQMLRGFLTHVERRTR